MEVQGQYFLYHLNEESNGFVAGVPPLRLLASWLPIH